MQCGLSLNREVTLSTVRLQMDPQRITQVPFLRPMLYEQPEEVPFLHLFIHNLGYWGYQKESFSAEGKAFKDSSHFYTIYTVL